MELRDALTTNSNVTRGIVSFIFLKGGVLKFVRRRIILLLTCETKFLFLFVAILGETIVRNNSVDQAVDYRDGMAKVCGVIWFSDRLLIFSFKA